MQLSHRRLFAVLLFCVLFPSACRTHKYKPAIVQQTFATPAEAANALLGALETDNISALLLLFGEDGKELILSGDPVQDKNVRAAFAAKARQAMKLEKDSADADRVLIFTGDDRDPFAVPLVRKANRWWFDTSAGINELLARRIGANELDTIDLCKAYVNAQKRYAVEDPAQTGIAVYADRFISSPGKKDGLYWPPDSTGPVSPISAQMTRAVAEGYSRPDERPVPYHGYYYKILTSQGPHAPGGRRDYIQRGLMLGGFGLVAWPAEYGASGIKTFIVDHSGVVLEKDLGTKTGEIATAISSYDPDPGWRPVH
jgi:hypothetical protein